jgi:hypothetical protein
MRPRTDPDAPAWKPREVAAALFLVAFLTWQIAAPAARLAAPRPAQFGWQMFSGLYRPAQVSVLLPDGEARAVQPSWYVETSRSDLRFERALARHLCRTDPRIAAVRLEPESAAATVLPCRP